MRYFFLISFLSLISACSFNNNLFWQEPDFNHIVANTTVAEKGPTYVSYDYKNISVDEIAPVAALYCRDKGGKQAVLKSIVLRPNNTRRALFICQDMTEF